MVVSNSIEVIRGWARRTFGRPRAISSTPEADSDVLSAMCFSARRMSGSNGRSYWYYFPNDEKDVEVVRFLLERNGVVPNFRWSRYLSYRGERRPAFRLSEAYLAKNKDVENFVKTICADKVIPYKEKEAMIQNARNLIINSRQK